MGRGQRFTDPPWRGSAIVAQRPKRREGSRYAPNRTTRTLIDRLRSEMFAPGEASHCPPMVINATSTKGRRLAIIYEQVTAVVSVTAKGRYDCPNHLPQPPRHLPRSRSTHLAAAQTRKAEVPWKNRGILQSAHLP